MNELKHHGILGMKWGVRRYQNKDGSLTAAGKKRYSNEDGDDIDSDNNKKSDRAKTAVKIGATVAGTALVAYGAYKASEYVKTEAAKKNDFCR